MPMVATTISEHFINIGYAIGEVEGRIQNMQELFDRGLVSQDAYDRIMLQLQQRLAEVLSSTS